MRAVKGSGYASMNDESSTEPPWIHTTGGRKASPLSRQWRRTPLARPSSGRAQALLHVPRVTGHGVRADPVDHRDEQIESEGAYLAVVHHLGRLGQVHEADDGGQRCVLEEHDELRHQ